MIARPTVTFAADVRRRRDGVLLRIPLALPSVAVLIGLSLPALAALAVAWPSAIVTRRVPAPVHRVLRVYVRYAVRFAAWMTLTARRYPRVRGVAQPLFDAEPHTHARLSALFRPLLALPSLALASAFGAVLAAAAIAAWFVALTRGRTTDGLLALGAFCIRYGAETLAYLLLVTPRAPRLEPASPTVQ